MNRNTSLKEKLVGNSFWSFISLTAKNFGTLALAIILARFLLPEGYGIYAIVISVVMFFYTFTDLGVNNALARYLSLALKKEKNKVSAYYRYLLKLKLILAVTISVLFLVLAYPLAFYVFKNPKLFMPFLIAPFYLFIFSFDSFYDQVFYSLEKVKYTSFKESLSQILRIIFALLIFYFIASSYQIIGIFLSFVLISTAMVLFSLFYINKLFPEIYEKPRVKIDKKKVRRFVKFLTIASISTLLLFSVDVIMLGIFVSPEYVGYYKIAFSLVFGLIGILNFPNLILLPVFTKLKNKKTKEVLLEIFRYISITSIPVIFGLLIFGRFFIKLIYGNAYLPGALPLYFLSPLIFPVLCVGLFLPFFFANEKPEIFAKLVLVTSFINVLLSLILINSLLLISPLWAAAGAGIATLASRSIYFASAIRKIKKEFKFSISFKPVLKPIFASLIMSGVLVYALRLSKGISLLSGILLILLGALVYLSTMIIIKGLGKKDLEVVKIILNMAKINKTQSNQ